MAWMLLVVLFLLPMQAHAATYWVSTAGTAASCGAANSDDDPGVAGGNSTATSPFYLSIATIDSLNCAVAGDTAMFKAGIYNGPSKRFDLIVPTGTSAGSPSRVLCEGDRTCEIAFSTALSSYNPVIQTFNVSHYVIGLDGHGFLVDGVNAGNGAAGIYINISADGIYTNVLIEGNHIRNTHAEPINFAESQPVRYYTNARIRKNLIEEAMTPLPSTQTSTHAIYLKGRDFLVEYNDTIGNMGYAIQCWHLATNYIIRYNKFRTSGGRSGFTCQDSETALPTNHQVYGNTFRSLDNTGICISIRGNSGPAKIYNNTCIGYPNFYTVYNGAGTGTEFKNNVCTGTCTRTIDPGDNIICGGDCAVINPTVTASSHFTDVANDDYSLIAGSSLINSGITTGGIVPANGTPDIGAHETFTCTTASINNNVLDLTCSMSGHTPINPISGVTGWTVDCTGAGCGTPVISNVSVPTGSSTLLRFSISGITGNSCAAGQTWTISYSSTTGNVRDSVRIGWNATTGNQRLHSMTNQAVTNACTGGGTSGPAAPHIYYKLNDGTSGTTPTTANDESPNTLHGTLNGGATWTAGRYGSGVLLTPDSTQSVSIPYGNAINPSTQSLTIAFGVFISPAQVSAFKSYFGAPGGTNQRFNVTTRHSTWQVSIQDKSDSTPNAPSDLAVQSGWNRVCIVADSGTDTITLHVNGVASTSASGVKTYTSLLALAGNFELGRTGGLMTGGGGIFDEFKLWTSVESCATDYLSWEPTTSPWAGNLAAVSFRFYAAKATPESVVIPLADVDTNITIPAGGAFTVAMQTDGTIADPSAISERLYYSCVACASAGTDLPVPSVATTDGLEFWGPTTEFGLLGGAHGVNIIGALAHVNGGTNLTADSIPVFDLAQNNSTVIRWTMRIVSGTPQGRQFCMKPREQSGLALNGYTPSSGACVTVGPPVAHNSF